MGDNNEKIEIKLVARADLGELPKADRALTKVDAAAQKTTADLQKLEKQADKTAAAVRRMDTARPSATAAREAERIRAGFREGQSELTRQAAERQSQIDADRRRSFLEAAKRQREAGAGEATAEAADGPSLLDTIKGVRASTAAAFGAVAGMAAAAAKAVREYTKAQEASAAVDASLAQRGQLLETVRQKVHGIAQAMSDRTALPKDHWLNALLPLIQNGADISNLDQIAKVVENIAGLMGGNVQRASLAVSKALVNNTENLKELGFQFSTNATQAEKWAEVVRQSERGAGVLAVRSQTLAGQFDQLKNAGSGLAVVIGKGIAHFSGLSQWMNVAARGAASLTRALGGTVPPAVLMNNHLQQSTQRLQEAQNAARQAVQQFNSIPAASQRAADAFNRQRAAADALRQSQDELGDAQLQLQLAQIDAREHGGQLSREQAILERARARSTSERSQFSRAQAFDTETASAAERLINQLGNNRGLAEGEVASAQAEVTRQNQAAAARVAAANAQQEVQRLKAKLAQEETESAFAGATGIESPGDIARRALATRSASQTRNEITAAEQRAAEAQQRAQAFGPGGRPASEGNPLLPMGTSRQARRRFVGCRRHREGWRINPSPVAGQSRGED